MLTDDDKGFAPERMGNRRFGKAKERIERWFVRFGAGAHLLEPVTKSRYWNIFCWTVIALGIVGWGILFWIVPPFSE